MKEFVISEVKAETAVLVGLITQQQDEAKTKEYLDELEFLADTAGAGSKKLSNTSSSKRMRITTGWMPAVQSLKRVGRLPSLWVWSSSTMSLVPSRFVISRQN